MFGTPPTNHGQWTCRQGELTEEISIYYITSKFLDEILHRSVQEQKEKRLHTPRPQNQLRLWLRVAWEGANSPPSFSPTSTKREAGSEKSWRPGCQPLLPLLEAPGSSGYIRSRRRNWVKARTPIHGSFGISLWGAWAPTQMLIGSRIQDAVFGRNSNLGH